MNAHPNPLSVALTYNVKRIDPRTGDDSHAEFDAPSTIDAIAQAIESWGHRVTLLEARPELAREIDAESVDVVFNISEGFRGRNREAQVPALLELLGIPYTGSDPATLCITLDKGLAKRIVRGAGVATPRAYALGPNDQLPEDLRFPVIVKPNSEGSSKGIEKTNVVSDEAALRAALLGFHERNAGLALVEEFLPGREFTVAILGTNPRVLSPMEIVFEAAPDSLPVYSYSHKIETEGGVSFVCPADVDEALDAELRRVALEAFNALGCRDISRIDLRLDADGVPNFIECNPLPGLSPGFSDLCVIAEANDITYRALIGEILECAVARMES